MIWSEDKKTNNELYVAKESYGFWKCEHWPKFKLSGQIVMKIYFLLCSMRLKIVFFFLLK